MKLLRKTFAGLMLTLVLIGALTLGFNIQPVKASGTVYVRADGSIDPPTAPISTLDNVTYTFTGNINDSIVVERNNIIVDGAGYTVIGSGSGNGITLTDRSNVTVGNMTINNFAYGIYLYSSSGNTLSGNNITANDVYGIWLCYSDNNVLSGNNVTNNSGGIWLDYSSNYTLSGNVMGGNRYNFGVGGDALSHYLHSVDASNLMDGKPVYYFVNQSDMVVNADAYPEVGYLGFVNCANVTVQGLNLTGNGQGLLLAFINDSKITGNKVANNWDGIYLCGSSNNSVSGNNITANDEDGIRLLGSSNNSITGNNITNNESNGIYLYSSSDNTISNNTLMSNRWVGISFQGASIIQLSSNNTIINNTVTGSVCGFQFWGGGEYYNTVENNIVYSNGAGIQLGDNARYNTFRGNTMSNNDYGVYLIGSSYNMFYHNNFAANTHQVNSTSSTSVWDDGYPSGGNYWSDYTSIDLYSGPYQNETGSDGIGDTTYDIDEDNIDGYPLMAPFSTFDAGVWNGVAYNVDVVSNSTISDFYFNPDEGPFIRFGVTAPSPEEAYTTGFCRVTIPKQILWVIDGWTVYYGSLTVDCITFLDENYTYLYFTYQHGYQHVTTIVYIYGTHVIPEFPSTMVLALFTLTTLIATTILKKKRKTKTQIP